MTFTLTAAKSESAEDFTSRTFWLANDDATCTLEGDDGETFVVEDLVVTVFVSDDTMATSDFVMATGRGHGSFHQYQHWASNGWPDSAPAWFKDAVDGFALPRVKQEG
jgi:hypothetical protein